MRKSIISGYRKHILLILVMSIPVWHVAHADVSLFSLLTYLASIGLGWNMLQRDTVVLFPKSTDILISLALSVLGNSLLLYFASFPSHYHQDEFITAYTSWTLPTLSQIDWFGAYPQVWVSQFPILFHILQKPWLILMGPTVEAIRLSVLPYAMGIISVLYLFARLFGSKLFALLTTGLFIFFAPHLYLESTGLHFVSSSFFFLLAVASWCAFIKLKHDAFALTAGIGASCGLLTYTSSYSTLPTIIGSAFVIWVWTKHPGHLLPGLKKAVAMAIIILAPFVTHALLINNFFTQRIDQVSVLWGSWSDTTGTTMPWHSLVWNQTLTAFQALTQDHIGGAGGYHFGGRGLMDLFTAVMLCIGILTSIWRGFVKRDPLHIVCIIAFVLPFLSGFILTIHPPPFHRISLLYPFMAFFVGQGIWLMTKHISPSVLRKGMIACLFGIFALFNWQRTHAMITNDTALYPQNSRAIAAYLNETAATGSTIWIAAYPSFYLPQELLFRTHNAFTLHADTTETILSRYQGDEPLILLNLTAETTQHLQTTYPAGKLLTQWNDIHLGDLTLFVPH
jgi:hypothetical protein